MLKDVTCLQRRTMMTVGIKSMLKLLSTPHLSSGMRDMEVIAVNICEFAHISKYPFVTLLCRLHLWKSQLDFMLIP